MKVSATLIRFAKGRETAYLRYGQLTGSRASAVSKIKRVADFFKNKGEREQLCAVRQVADEIRLLLPAENSRQVNLRRQMLSLLDQAKLNAHSNLPTPNHGRSQTAPTGAQGSQLNLVFR